MKLAIICVAILLVSLSFVQADSISYYLPSQITTGSSAPTGDSLSRAELRLYEDCRKIGCYTNGKCYPYGFRKNNKYCADETTIYFPDGKPRATQKNIFVFQLGNDMNCENDFECLTNDCINWKCQGGYILNDNFRFDYNHIIIYNASFVKTIDSNLNSDRKFFNLSSENFTFTLDVGEPLYFQEQEFKIRIIKDNPDDKKKIIYFNIGERKIDYLRLYECVRLDETSYIIPTAISKDQINFFVLNENNFVEADTPANSENITFLSDATNSTNILSNQTHLENKEIKQESWKSHINGLITVLRRGFFHEN